MQRIDLADLGCCQSSGATRGIKLFMNALALRNWGNYGKTAGPFKRVRGKRYAGRIKITSS